MYLSTRMQAVQRPIIPIVGQLVRSRPGAISLGQGVVHFPPPPEAAAAIAGFLADADNHKYHAVEGIAPLLAALERKLAEKNHITVLPDSRVVVTAGSNMAFFNALLAIADPGDEVILISPYYFNHEMAVAMLNCRTVAVPVDANYQLDVEAVRRAVTQRTRAVVTISPNNPTGAVYSPEALTQINELCAAAGIYHIHDEAYEYFIYEGAEHFSPGSLPGAAEHTISLFSFSKTFGFASWRIGYMVVPQALGEAVQKAQDTDLICPPVISQHAAIGALSAPPDYLRDHVANVSQVRQMVLDELRPLRSFCEIPPALGAFYFLLRLDTNLDAMQVVERLVREFGVAVIPGGTFGIETGCHLRVAYGALERDTIAEGVGRLVRGLQSIVGG